MTASEGLVRQCFAEHQHLAQRALRTQATAQLARAAVAFLRCGRAIEIDPQIDQFGNPEIRAQSITVDELIEHLIANLTASGEFRTLIDAAHATAGLGAPSRTKISQYLRQPVQEYLTSAESSNVLGEIEDHEIYGGMADLLSGELFRIGSANPQFDEAVLLNHALLVYFLRRWRIPFARFSGELTRLNSGRLGIRGYLLSIQNRHFESNNTDDFAIAPTVFVAAAMQPSTLALSDVLRAIQTESNAIANNNGFFHRAMPTHAVPNALIRANRELMYPQYENTALLFMTLAGMEFLLRSYCPHAGQPDQPIVDVISQSSQLSPGLIRALEDIYSRLNIRNRCMHGSFLDIEGRREDLLRASGILQGNGVPVIDLSHDGSLPGGTCSVALSALNTLAQELATTSTAANTAWTQHFLLTPAELAFARTVPCEFLHDLVIAEAWRQHIRDYLRHVTPCLSVPLQFGTRSWFAHGPAEELLPGFFFLELLFEPFLRLTLHLGEQTVLQAAMSSAGGANHFRIQYRMMDPRGLLSQSNINWLTAHLEENERPTAERVLTLAAKARDAVAHGAVFQFTDDIHSVYGHLIIKAIQLVVEAGVRHVQQGENPRPQ